MGGPRNLLADVKITAGVGGTGGDKSAVAVETELRIAAVGEGNFVDFTCKSIFILYLPLKFSA